MERAQRRIAVPLSEILECPPELEPAGFGRAAEEDVAAFGGFFVDDAEGVCILRGEAARIELGFDECAREADNDENLRGRIAVAALPGRVHAADGARESVAWTVEIDRADFAVVFSQDAQMRAGFGRKGIAELRERGDEILPAEFIAQREIHLVREAKPWRVNRSKRQGHRHCTEDAESKCRRDGDT